MILPAVFGWDRMMAETYPILPMLAGANLPGDVLSRFDVIWLAFLLYSLLFAVGSMFYYGNRILESAHLFSGRFWMWILAWILSGGPLGMEHGRGLFSGSAVWICAAGTSQPGGCRLFI